MAVTRNPAASELGKVAMLGTQSIEKSRLGRMDLPGCYCICTAVPAIPVRAIKLLRHTRIALRHTRTKAYLPYT
jgi:hypothetical protein